MFPRKFTCPLEKKRIEFSSPTAKYTSPELSGCDFLCTLDRVDTYVFSHTLTIKRLASEVFLYVHVHPIVTCVLTIIVLTIIAQPTMSRHEVSDTNEVRVKCDDQ